jgi:hypothetical protein
MRIFPLIAACSLALFAYGCNKPKPGSKCTEAAKSEGNFKGACLSKGEALACVDGKYTSVKCESKPVGCMETMGSVSCSMIIDEDEPCFGDKEYTCSTDHKKMLECSKNKWSLKMACKSSKGCVENAKGVSCTSAEAEEGDPCEKDQKDSGSCNPDKDKLLVCDGKKFVVASTCRGQNKCRALGTKLDCDTSLAKIDDPCEDEGKLSCDVAKKVLLKCDGEKFVKEQECKKRCNNAFDKYSCD